MEYMAPTPTNPPTGRAFVAAVAVTFGPILTIIAQVVAR